MAHSGSLAVAGALLLVLSSVLVTPASAQTCTDKVKNGAETDIDCGGSCPGCLTSRNCLTNNDCLSLRCTSGKCQEPPECYNKVKDRRETDVDCGGGECFQACAVDQMCLGGVGSWNCRSRICSNGRCLEADSCKNLVQDGLETDWNCGGGACQPCGGRMKCQAARDCKSGVCTSGLCVVPATCTNGRLDPGEGDSDCGGPCPLCGTARTCNNNGDCLSNTCTGGLCREAPHCFNGVVDGRETDVDCGGGACNAACDNGKKCVGTWDCKSRICQNGICVAPAPPPPSTPAPSCTDGILNNGETAVDCGGPNCPACAGGKTCYDDGDCGSGYCIFS